MHGSDGLAEGMCGVEGLTKGFLALEFRLDGAGDRNRTYDLRVTSALLYRLSYTG